MCPMLSSLQFPGSLTEIQKIRNKNPDPEDPVFYLRIKFNPSVQGLAEKNHLTCSYQSFIYDKQMFTNHEHFNSEYLQPDDDEHGDSIEQTNINKPGNNAIV